MGCSVLMRNSHFTASANAGGQDVFRRLKSFGLNLFLATLLCVCVVMAIPLLLEGQHPTPPSEKDTQGYPVTVEGHEAFEIFEPLGPISAHERAQRASERIAKLVYTPGA